MHFYTTVRTARDDKGPTQIHCVLLLICCEAAAVTSAVLPAASALRQQQAPYKARQPRTGEVLVVVVLATVLATVLAAVLVIILVFIVLVIARVLVVILDGTHEPLQHKHKRKVLSIKTGNGFRRSTTGLTGTYTAPELRNYCLSTEIQTSLVLIPCQHLRHCDIT